MNDLVKLLDLQKDKPWDYEYLSENPNITWEIVQQNPDKPWDWSDISRNPNITSDIVINNPIVGFRIVPIFGSTTKNNQIFQC